MQQSNILGKKIWVPRKYAYEVQDFLLSNPDFGYDFVLKKSKIKKKFKKNSKFVAFFINQNGGIDHFEVNSEDLEHAWREFCSEPEEEIDYTEILDCI
jgi:hypothetical protein